MNLAEKLFEKAEVEWYLTERISYHFSLRYMNYDVVDEILFPASNS